jgi:endonuclease YncB( thermonuclease family)
MKSCAITLVLCGFVASLVAADADIYARRAIVAGAPTVIDGDTLRIKGRVVRLYGIDAPEQGQRCEDAQGRRYACGLLAASFLEGEIAERHVACARQHTDGYGRAVAVCSVNGRDLAAALVQAGYALEDLRYSDGRYTIAEQEARAARRGMWGGRFDPPWIWRLRQPMDRRQQGDIR